MVINWIQYPDSLTFNTSDKIIVSSPDGNTKNLSFPFTSSSSGITFNSDTYFTGLQGSSSTTALVIDGSGKISTNSLQASTNGEATKVRLNVRFGEAVVKGDPVYVSGYHGSSGPVIMSKANAANASHMPAFGLADADYANNATGYAISLGNLTDLNTSSYSVGDTLYVATNGGLTSTKPTGANYIQNVATVSRSNANNGQLEVTATGRSNDVPTPLHINHTNQDVGVGTMYPKSKLHINGALTFNHVSDPANPTAGTSVLWATEAGDLKIKINVANTVVTKTITTFE